jgi:LysM repeat protein
MKVKFTKLFAATVRRKLQASAAAARRAMQPADDYDEEPQTKLSSAFIVVLILHVVAVVGIYAFNSIKTRRQGEAASVAASTTSVKPKATPALPKTEEAVAPLAALTPVETAPSASRARTYQVKAGDTLTRIAIQHRVSVADLEAANSAKAVATLRPGQTLSIPAVRPSANLTALRTTVSSTPRKSEETPKVSATTKVTPKTYVVAKGDNPVGIARKLGVGYDELLKLNKIDDPKKLKPGQTLKVPAKKN